MNGPILLMLMQAAVGTTTIQPLSSPGYPTEVLADYVIGCMAANGQTHDVLRRCSCSIDAIASKLSYDDYVNASTVLSMRGQSGERASLFNEVKILRETVKKLREAQVEADFECF